MKVTYNWLKDFVEIRLKPKDLSDKLTMAGLEVVSLEEKNGDFVFEIEVTSNRPDWLSVLGIAREIAAITGKKLSRLAPSRRALAKIKPQGPLWIKIADKNDCPFYSARVIRGVRVGPSPDWLKNRLESVGLRSVNNIVDITNYILLEYGEPLHAFDLDKLSGDSIMVRRAHSAEKIITIDQAERELGPDVLVISDKGRVVAIAGIIGGKDTEVTSHTKNILLEAAIFNPVLIRRARQKLGIQTESAYRFERGIDPQIAELASGRAAGLIQEISGGISVLAKSTGKVKPAKRTLCIDTLAAPKILGAGLEPRKVKSILTHLEFSVTQKTKTIFKVGIPSHRPDVRQDVDLWEEVARIYGYALIPTTLPALVTQIKAGEKRDLAGLTRNILVSLGLNEVITYSLMDRETLQAWDSALASEAIEILNPLSKDQGVLRPTIIPSLARCVAYNLNQRQAYINIFEIARVFGRSRASGREELMLGMALCGERAWLSAQGRLKEELGPLHLKGILETVFARLGIMAYNFNTAKGETAIAVSVGRDEIGIFSRLPSVLLDKLGFKEQEVWVAEVSLDKLFSSALLKKRFTPLAKFPSIARDISLLLQEEVKVGELLGALQDRGRPLLRQVEIVDYYKGKQVPAGFKSLTLSCIYRLDERTLTDAEINPVHSMLLKVLTERFGAQIR